MKRKTRRIIFFCSLAAFLIASYVVILYAQGYQYDFSNYQFIRTGAIYLKVNTDAHVLLNGVEKGTTSFLGNSASLDGLLPGTYTVSVQKKGYSSWQKVAEVKEGYVDDYPNVLLLPESGDAFQDLVKDAQTILYPTPSPTPSSSLTPTPSIKKTPTPSPLPSVSPTPDPNAPYYVQDGDLYVQSDKGPERIASNVAFVNLSPDGRKLAWASGSQLWVYWLANTDYQPYHQAGDMVLLNHFGYTIKALDWFHDSDHIILDSSGYKVIEIDARGGVNIINL
ncbi:MAG TPA: hypothetical protein VFK07_01360 [Candidatus Paceibacterota bacterium]|nr:hypothetical protein [Candidatus Paceibacterota bacterium]